MSQLDLKKIASPVEMALVAVVFILITVAFTRLFFSPQSAQIKDLSDSLKQLKAEQSDVKKQNDLLAQQNLKKQQAVSEDKSGNIQLSIIAGQKKPSFTQVSDLLETLVAPTFARGVDLASMDSKAPQVLSGYSQIPLHLQGQADFGSLIQFIRRIGGLQALVTIDSMAITIREDEKSRVDFEMTTTLYQTEEVSHNAKH